MKKDFVAAHEGYQSNTFFFFFFIQGLYLI